MENARDHRNVSPPGGRYLAFTTWVEVVSVTPGDVTDADTTVTLAVGTQCFTKAATTKVD